MTETAPASSCKTLFIIGAGAGYDYNMPMGEDLIGEISRLVSTSNHLKKNGGAASVLDTALHHLENYEFSNMQSALSRILGGLVFSRSIDTLLTDTADETVSIVGKIAISQVLSEREARTEFFTKGGKLVSGVSTNAAPFGRMKDKTIRDTWMPSFFRELRAGLTKDQFKKRLQNTAVITFNYDRLFEHFLDVAIAQYDGLPLADAKKLRSELQIIHPYGMLAPLEVAICSINTQHVANAPTYLKTYDENPNDNELIRIRSLVTAAQKIIFLGFGFHQQNMDLLGFPRPVSSKKSVDIFGTAMGLSSRKKERIIHSLGTGSSRGFTVTQQLDRDTDFSFDTCKDLIDEHGDAFFA